MAHHLYLLRHAKSDWNNTFLSDFERSLNQRGRRSASKIASFISTNKIHPELILCSSARRTRETLEIIQHSFNPKTEFSIENELYASSVYDLFKRIQRVPDSIKSLMIIGHNPGIQDLSLELSAPSELRDQISEKFPTGSLVDLIIKTESWSSTSPGDAEIISFTTPNDI